MASNYFTDPLVLIIDSVASLYILAVLLRFLLQWCSAPYYNSISQFLITLTHPPLKILRRFIPPIGKIDSASLVLVLSLQMLTNVLILLLNKHTINIGALAVLSLADLISLSFNIFIFAVFARAILSWINPGSYDAVSSVLTSLTDPVLNLCRKFIPIVGGFDLSPLAALLMLQLARMMVLPPFQQLAAILS